MDVFVTVIAPIIIATVGGLLLAYFKMMRPAPVALGSVLAKVCVVSADEISEYCEASGTEDEVATYLRRETAWKQLKVTRRYIGQMTWNTRLFQQVARFEELKIDPAKSSLHYSTRETLALRLAEEAAVVRWVLVKGQVVVTLRALSNPKVRVHAVRKLQELIRQYKHLELDVVALVGMASDECYYSMLIERLGLSEWGLIEGKATT